MRVHHHPHPAQAQPLRLGEQRVVGLTRRVDKVGHITRPSLLPLHQPLQHRVGESGGAGGADEGGEAGDVGRAKPLLSGARRAKEVGRKEDR